VYVNVATRQPGEKLWGGLHPDFPLSPSGAAWLGEALVKVAAQANAPRRPARLEAGDAR
jgi:hypothetical protein